MIYISLLVIALLELPPEQAGPCRAVKRAVAQYGEAAVESWARSKGISGPSFRGDAKHRTRNLEIPGLVLRTIPE